MSLAVGETLTTWKTWKKTWKTWRKKTVKALKNLEKLWPAWPSHPHPGPLWQPPTSPYHTKQSSRMDSGRGIWANLLSVRNTSAPQLVQQSPLYVMITYISRLRYVQKSGCMKPPLFATRSIYWRRAKCLATWTLVHRPTQLICISDVYLLCVSRQKQKTICPAHWTWVQTYLCRE